MTFLETLVQSGPTQKLSLFGCHEETKIHTGVVMKRR